MLSLERVKLILNNPTISDDEAVEIRDSFRSLAEVIFEKWQEERDDNQTNENEDETTISRR